jgi:ribosome-associated toxin RatA of RatAB toxin-antitoxin module
MQSHQTLDQKSNQKSNQKPVHQLVKVLAKKLSTGSAIFLAIAAIACSTPVMAIHASLFDGPVDSLPSWQRDSLRNGQTVVTGEQGEYVAKVLISASPDTVWGVLTDYGNLSRFIPNMTSSKILSNSGSSKVVEQIDSRQVFLFSVVSRTKLAIQETYQERIDFSLIDGDLAAMEGSWKMEPVSSVPGRAANQVLITYSVYAQPNGSTPTDAFYTIFKDALDGTLQAIKREANYRN